MMRIFFGGAILSLVAVGIFLFHVWAYGFWPTLLTWSLTIGLTALIVFAAWLIAGG